MTLTEVGPFRKIRTAEQVRAAAALIPRTRPRWQGEEGPVWRLTVSPGSIQVGTKDYSRANRTANAAEDRRLREDPSVTLEKPATSKRGQITEWSKSSRSRMVKRLCTLDYSPLVDDGRIPAMVTLTMPGEWLSVAPDADAFKAIVNKFRGRYRSSWGHDMAGVWKMEFQRRGAPHLHILTVVPDGLSRGSQLPFQQWLSMAWAAAVNHQDPEQRRRHELAGTGIDYEETLRYGDAKRIAVYFTKHGTFADKEYQNHMPAEWVGAPGGGARFWGYWKLPVLEETVELSDNAHDAVTRHLRKVQRSAGYIRPHVVYRVDSRTGVIRTRKVNRRVKYMRGNRGFLSVNDGVSTAADISRIIGHHLESQDFFSTVPNHAPAAGRAIHGDFYSDRAAVPEEFVYSHTEGDIDGSGVALRGRDVLLPAGAARHGYFDVGHGVKSPGVKGDDPATFAEFISWARQRAATKEPATPAMV